MEINKSAAATIILVGVGMAGGLAIGKGVSAFVDSAASDGISEFTGKVTHRIIDFFKGAGQQNTSSQEQLDKRGLARLVASCQGKPQDCYFSYGHPYKVITTIAKNKHPVPGS
jgi:hypothetical protein